MTMNAPSMTMDAPPMVMDAPSMTMDAPPMVMDAPSMTMDAPSMVMDAPSMVVDMTPVSQDFWTPRMFYGHGWAKYQCPSNARIFKRMADDSQFSLGNVAERRMTIARHFNAGLVVKWLQVPQGRPSSAVPAGLMAM